MKLSGAETVAFLLRWLLAASIVGSSSGRGGHHGRGAGGAGGGGVQLCKDVHSRCFARDGCRAALEYYMLYCMGLTGGSEADQEPYQCTVECRNALVMLLSSDEHDGPGAFRDCDCEDDEFCLRQRERISVCADVVEPWLVSIADPNTPISCSLAGLVCSADTPCLVAIDYYHDHCNKLIESRNPRCTSRCNNSLNILYRQPKAQKLRTCYCDGTELYNCTALKENTRTLCYGHKHRHDHTGGPGRDCQHNTPTAPSVRPGPGGGGLDTQYPADQPDPDEDLHRPRPNDDTKDDGKKSHYTQSGSGAAGSSLGSRSVWATISLTVWTLSVVSYCSASHR